MIRPYLRDIVNEHKTQKLWKVHSGNKVIDYKTALEDWKYQLAMSINFISSKDFDETHNMRTESNNIEIMMGSKTDEIIEDEIMNYFSCLLMVKSGIILL